MSSVTPIVRDDVRWGYLDLDARRYERRRYGGLGRRLNLRLLERAVGRALAGVAPGALVLHVPSGTGILGRSVARRGLRVVDGDISPAMLEVARERGHAVHLVRLDLEAPPYRPGTFAAVVCTRYLMHASAEKRPRLLATLAKLTHGPLVATYCHPYTLKSLTRSFRRRIGWPSKRSPRLDREALAAEVAAAGLHLERVIPVLPLFSEVWVVVMRNPAPV
jgi:SAM-dependent methyltransferase